MRALRILAGTRASTVVSRRYHNFQSRGDPVGCRLPLAVSAVSSFVPRLSPPWLGGDLPPHGYRSELQVAPQIPEIVKAFFAGEPFCPADCAFGEGATGFGVMAEIDSVGGRFKDDFVHADYVAFAKGSDL